MPWAKAPVLKLIPASTACTAARLRWNELALLLSLVRRHQRLGQQCPCQDLGKGLDRRLLARAHYQIQLLRVKKEVAKARMGQLPGASKARGVSCESSTSVRSTNNLPSAAASPASFQMAASTSALDQCGPRQRTSSCTERRSPEGHTCRSAVTISGKVENG